MAEMDKYLPDAIRGIREFQAITATETGPFNDCRAAITRMLDNQFVPTADSAGLSRYEKMFGLASDKTAEIEDRRFRILSKINNRLPYSMGWLRGKLDALFGIGNYILTRDVANYLITVEADVQFENVILDLYDDLRKSIPANMTLETYIASAHPATQYHACWMQTFDEIYL